MKKLSRLVLGSVFLFLLFTLLSYLINQSLLDEFDLLLMVTIQNLVPRSLDTLLSFFSLSGSFEISSLFLIFLFMVRKQVQGIFVFFFYFLALAVEILGKTFLQHPGPPQPFFRYDLGSLFPSSFYQSDFSYPSGHVMRTIFIAVLVFYFIYTSRRLDEPKKNVLIAITLLYSLFMIISRVSLGEHWPSDVIAGSILGAGFGLLTIKVLSTNIISKLKII